MAARLGRSLTRRGRILVISAIVVTGLYLFAFAPVRTFVDQRQEMAKTEQQYEILSSTNDRLRERASQLTEDKEIERLAREQYELVNPGQEAYAVMPPPANASDNADSGKDQRGLWDRIRDAVPLF